MCLRSSNVARLRRFNWDGDEILHSTVVEASRYIPGTRRRYPIDIREYLISKNNAVLHDALDEAASEMCDPRERDRFWLRKPGSFDHRVRTLCGYVSKRVQYKRRSSSDLNFWLFPDETLEARKGDCKDLAFLLAGLILASGVSGYVVRIALGRLENRETGKAMDHIWVMYRNEAGYWLLLDPLLYTKGTEKTLSRSSKPSVPTIGVDSRSDQLHEYVPFYVFNDEHLWRIHQDGESPDVRALLEGGRFWDVFTPTFAATVHSHILDEALKDMPWSDRQYVKAVSLEADVNIATYDPCDHFDNAYIQQGWHKVEKRLATGDLTDLGLACHGIADFYAHSSWGVFGERDSSGKLRPMLDTQNPDFGVIPDYQGDAFPLVDADRFSINEALWTGTRAEGAAAWAGRLISGRYAQNGDRSAPAIPEGITYIPSRLRDAVDFRTRGALPHHNEIAVDDESYHAEAHRLYPGVTEYQAAFCERYTAAVDHIGKVYAAWKAIHVK